MNYLFAIFAVAVVTWLFNLLYKFLDKDVTANSRWLAFIETRMKDLGFWKYSDENLQEEQDYQRYKDFRELEKRFQAKYEQDIQKQELDEKESWKAKMLADKTDD